MINEMSRVAVFGMVLFLDRPMDNK